MGGAISLWCKRVITSYSIHYTKLYDKISELNIKYETDKKDTQINLLKKDAEIKKSHNLFLNFLIITLLLIMILLFFIIRVKTKLLKSQKTSYEQQEKVNSLLLQKQEIERA